MSGSFERFELSTTAKQLVEEAGRDLTGRKPLPRKTDESGTKTGAKGFQYDWRRPHQLLWDQVSKDRADTIKAWSGNPSVRIVKSVVTLEAEHSLRTPLGMMGMIIPIDGQTANVAFRTSEGNVIEGKEWNPCGGYQLQEEVAMRAIKDDITFILVRVSRVM